MNNPFKSILFLCAILLASLPAFGGVDDFKDFKSFGDLKAEDFPKLLDFLKQNGKFKDEKFNGDISFNNYLYWLGLCNLNDKDFRRAYISFLYGASFACTIKSDKMAHCKLAAANVLLLLRPSAGVSKAVQEAQIEFFRSAHDAKLEEGTRGLAVTYSLNEDHANADEMLTKLMAFPLTMDRAQILIFCSLVLNDPKYFIHVVNEIGDREIVYEIRLINNLAVAYMKFRDSGIKEADKKATGFWNDMDDYVTVEKYEKTFNNPRVISVPVHGKTNPLEVSRNERRMVARLGIGSIGWANPALDLPPEYDDLFVNQTKETKETETKH